MVRAAIEWREHAHFERNYMKKHLVLALALAAAPFAASAGPLSYSYVEGGYLRTEIDDLDGYGDGFAINGSVEINDMFHVFGGYAMQDAGDDGLAVDLDQLRLGLGYRYAVSDRTDLVARGAYERAESDIRVDDGFFGGDYNADSNGYSVEVGLRSALTDSLEVSVLGGYADVTSGRINGNSVDVDADDNDQFYGRLGAQLKFNPTWGIVGEGTFAKDVTQLFVGVRASF